MHPLSQRFALITFAVLVVAGSARAGDVYNQTNLVSDISGMAQQTDPNLKSPWGLVLLRRKPFWISDQASQLERVVGHNALQSSGSHPAQPSPLRFR